MDFIGEISRMWQRCFFVLCLCFCLVSCGGKKDSFNPNVIFDEDSCALVQSSETKEQFVAELSPQGQGLTSWNQLAPGLKRSLAYVRTKNLSSYAFNRCGKTITWGSIERSLLHLLRVLPRLDVDPQLLTREFQWVSVPGGIRYTAYQEVCILGSRQETPRFSQPLYRTPPDLNSYKAAHGGHYYTRRQIDQEKVLAGRNLEAAWVAPFDAYWLQIEASGCVSFPDGTRISVNYGGQNGYKFHSFNSFTTADGRVIHRGDLYEMRQWANTHPEEAHQQLLQDPSYVFFTFGAYKGSTGAMGSKIDGNCALAVDPKHIPLGSIVTYGLNTLSSKDRTQRIGLRGIGLAQDTGGAIKGNRIDIFCGSGKRAEFNSYFLGGHGPAWILLKKTD